MKKHLLVGATLGAFNLYNMERSCSTITGDIQKHVKAFVGEGRHTKAAPQGLAHLCDIAKRVYNLCNQTNRPVIMSLGAWNDIEFAVKYDGLVWTLCTSTVFFKGELHDPDGSCLEEEKKSFWYTLLKTCSAQKDFPFPVVIDAVSKLFDVTYEKETPFKVSEDRYRATIDSVFISSEDLVAFINGSVLEMPNLACNLLRKSPIISCEYNVAELLSEGMSNSNNNRYQGVIIKPAERRGLLYITTHIQVSHCDEWRDPAMYLVEVERKLLYGKLLVAFHMHHGKQVIEKVHGPHVMDKDVKATWRSESRTLEFEYLSLLSKK